VQCAERSVCVRTVALDTIEPGDSPKGTVGDVEELNTRFGI